MAAENHARQFARAEWHDHAATRLHSMLKSQGQRVRECLIERHGQADIAELVGQTTVYRP